MQKRIIPDVVSEQDVVTLHTSATIHEAVQAMSTHKIAAVAVTDGAGKLVGIVSERDMTHRVLACGLSPQATRVSTIMTQNLQTLRPDASALDAIKLMLGRNIRHLPVVSDDGFILAMISMRDLLRSTLRDLDIEILQNPDTTAAQVSDYPQDNL
ncbi:MAG: CBS domain-containing protein [Magnetovibrio sp.]|nr:CBS domain-containing protein [Magnetovibrio sp.]